ncbi:hypothetical protein Areg01_05420 [Actinoplanes regularis]|nr:hypothetical protein Areg01_05420 [Actinoplanes regularis]
MLGSGSPASDRDAPLTTMTSINSGVGEWARLLVPSPIVLTTADDRPTTISRYDRWGPVARLEPSAVAISREARATRAVAARPGRPRMWIARRNTLSKSGKDP